MRAVAQGTYRYWRDGALQAITEPWQLRRTPDGLVLKGQRLVDGKPALEIEAQYGGGLCSAMRLHWRGSDQDSRVHYRRCGETLEWRFDDDAGFQVFVLPQGCLLFPLLRAAAGPLVRKLADSPRSLVLPALHNPADSERFLRPLLSARRAVLLDGKAGHYRYYGGEYGEQGSDYWLDQQGLLLRYRWDSPQGVWEVRLEDHSASARDTVPE